jgi:hypothetical protein
MTLDALSTFSQNMLPHPAHSATVHDDTIGSQNIRPRLTFHDCDEIVLLCRFFGVFSWVCCPQDDVPVLITANALVTD